MPTKLEFSHDSNFIILAGLNHYDIYVYDAINMK
jgi:hypothetical protein